MVSRSDISDKLIHFTKGQSDESAFENLRSMINAGVVLGSNNCIRGGHKCVCFTEAPIDTCRSGFVNQNNFSRYSLFGLMFSKQWIFAQGGRPVIYQSEQEFDALPEGVRWRHVRYEPNADKPIDFTWEREWRVPLENMSFDPSVAIVVVPSAVWAQQLMDEHEYHQNFQIEQYKLIMDEDLAEQYREEFPWRIVILH
jgi:hypothetical protein